MQEPTSVTEKVSCRAPCEDPPVRGEAVARGDMLPRRQEPTKTRRAGQEEGRSMAGGAVAGLHSQAAGHEGRRRGGAIPR